MLFATTSAGRASLGLCNLTAMAQQLISSAAGTGLDASAASDDHGKSFPQPHIVTAEEAASRQYSMEDVVLPLPGRHIAYPSNDTAQVCLALCSAVAICCMSLRIRSSALLCHWVVELADLWSPAKPFASAMMSRKGNGIVDVIALSCRAAWRKEQYR